MKYVKPDVEVVDFIALQRLAYIADQAEGGDQTGILSGEGSAKPLPPGVS